MRSIFILISFCICSISFSQVVATGDTTLCENMAGQVELTLTAESFNVDLTDSGIYSDDTYGGVIDIGFDFTFYGNSFNQVVLSSNNHLTFNLGNANNYSDWTITDPAPNNFDCPLNSILCPWQDIYPGVNGNGTIQYATTGEAPNRVFIASFCGIPMFSCTDICYTSQIKLFEGTNIIETHIAQKVLCTTWNQGAAIHGLHNDNGTIAHIVTGLDGIERNYPNQWTCENDGWRFIPNGNNDYIIENITFAPAVAGTDIIWQDDNGNIIGNGSEITVTPTETTVYTAGASLCGSAGDWCGFEGGIEGDEVLIEFVPTEITTNFSNPLCYGEFGSAEISFPSTGNWNYTVQQNNNTVQQGITQNSNSLSIFDLSPGNYTILVENEFGCSDTENITLSQPEQIEDTFIEYDVNCFGEDDGSISIILSGGTSPFEVFMGSEDGSIFNQLSGINSNQEVVFDNLAAGNYYFTGLDQNGCYTDGQEVFFSINEPEELLFDYDYYDVTCSDANDGSIQINVYGGTGNYTYLWLADNGFNSNDQDIYNLAGGNYTLTITDENNCSSSEIIEITEDAGIVLSYIISDYNSYGVSCENETDGYIDISISGGTAPYSYNWTGPNGFISNSEDLVNISAGNYNLELFDENDCIAQESFFLSEPEELEALYGQDIAWICDNGGSAFSQVSGGVEPYNFSWIGPNGFQNNNSYISQLDPGIYTLNILDQNDCILEDNEILIEEIVGPVCQFSASSYEFMLSNDPVNFYDNSFTDPNYNIDLISWEWDFGDGVISNDQNPSHIYDYPGLYYVWLTVEDENGCTHKTMKTINVLEEFFSYSPNAFSPNGDGINDTFQPILTDIDFNTYELNIFNRWGDIIFKTDNYSKSWDGTFNGEPMIGGVYTYKINYKTRRGVDQKEVGQIILIK